MNAKILTILLILFIMIPTAFAIEGELVTVATCEPNTYYVDFVGGSDSNTGACSDDAWRLAPGMPGFGGSYSHSAGDRFVFKGGVTWNIALFTISYSGASGSYDEYTTDHSWFSGASFSQPTFDFGGSGTGLVANSRSYFKVNDINFVNVGPGSKLKGFNIDRSTDYIISNNSFSPDAWICLYLHWSGGSSYSNIIVDNNDITGCAMGIIVALEAGNMQVDNVQLKYNKIHDFAPWLGGGAHGDGIHTWGANGDNTRELSNLQIYNNYFYGDWGHSTVSTGTTSFMFLEHHLVGAKVYNNIMETDLGSTTWPTSDNSIWITDGGVAICPKTSTSYGHEIYNNVVYARTSQNIPMGLNCECGATNCSIKNNIIINTRNGIALSNTNGHDIDYNDIMASLNYGNIAWAGKSFSQWQGYGYGLNSFSQDPLFVNPDDALGPDGILWTADDGFQLQANSPAKNAGSDGKDLGAYAYTSQAPTYTPQPVSTPAPTPVPASEPTCIDNDGDGYGTNCGIGSDCNDNNANINPSATEICGNGIDDDCQDGDATCQTTPTPTPQPTGNELIVNGAFESFSKNLATNWLIHDDGSVAYTTSKGSGKSGNAQRVDISSVSSWGLFIYQKPLMQLGNNYKMSFWYKTSGSNGIIAGVTNDRRSEFIVSETLPGTYGVWRFYEVNFNYNNKLADQARFLSNDVGTVWIDDFSLKKIDTNVPSSTTSCTLTSAKWSTTGILEGNTATLTVSGSNCDGKTLSFVVWENDKYGGDDPVNINPSSAVFSSGVASTSWIAEWQKDWGDPEYYFIAGLIDKNIVKSSNQLIVKSLPPPCVEGTYQLTNQQGNNYFGAQKCVNGKWVSI